jgi:hypothetical protein
MGDGYRIQLTKPDIFVLSWQRVFTEIARLHEGIADVPILSELTPRNVHFGIAESRLDQLLKNSIATPLPVWSRYYVFARLLRRMRLTFSSAYLSLL